MAPSSKAQQLTPICNLLKKRYKAEPSENRLSVLEAIVLGICREGSTAEQANLILSRIKDHFFDWNEVRVSTIKEIQDVLVGLPDPQVRANSIRLFLRQLFTKTYGFNLDALTKKPLKESLKTLQEFDALKSDYVLATVVQRALGGHAIPTDNSALRALIRLGVTEPDSSSEAARSSVERVVPKAQGSQFQEWMEQLCLDTCSEREPACTRCELRELCPTGLGEVLIAPPAQSKSKSASTSARKAGAATEKAKKNVIPDAPSTPDVPAKGKKSKSATSKADSVPKKNVIKPESEPALEASALPHSEDSKIVEPVPTAKKKAASSKKETKADSSYTPQVITPAVAPADELPSEEVPTTVKPTKAASKKASAKSATVPDPSTDLPTNTDLPTKKSKPTKASPVSESPASPVSESPKNTPTPKPKASKKTKATDHPQTTGSTEVEAYITPEPSASVAAPAKPTPKTKAKTKQSEAPVKPSSEEAGKAKSKKGTAKESQPAKAAPGPKAKPKKS